ncbi:MAG: CCA tRNA nucleotidyltransferase [Candidatus Thorarchaeota archaeon]|nr:CCA tRNA nucleotidyltransferase [Candidatus Thorarchaeota archaeon]
MSEELVRLITTAGFELYQVGGSIRDELLQRESNDIDFATNATPEQLKELAATQHIRCELHGESFKVIRFMLAAGSFEVATYRRDGIYSDGRHPDTVEYARSIIEDLSRRDFTMNAMAKDARTGHRIDPFGGLHDIKNRKVVTVGYPKSRFREDRLRIIRAFRFASQLGFTVHGAIIKAVRSDPIRGMLVTDERLQVELDKILMSHQPSIAFEIMKKANFVRYLLPEVARLQFVMQPPPHFDNVWQHTMNVLDYTAMLGGDLTTRLAALLHDIGKFKEIHITEEPTRIRFSGHASEGAIMSEMILRRFKYSNKMMKDVFYLINYHMALKHVDKTCSDTLRRYLRRVVNRQGEEQAWRLVTLNMADGLDLYAGYINYEHIPALEEVAAELRINPIKPAINGHDIMRITGCKGPMIGYIKEEMLKLLENEELSNDVETLTEFVEGWKCYE